MKNIANLITTLKNRDGFSLIEAFTAVTILGLSALGLFASLYIGLSSVSEIREHITASSIVQEKMEDVRKGFFPVVGQTSFTACSYGAFSNPDFPLVSATGIKKVEEYSGIPTGELVRVVIELNWNSRLRGRINTKRTVTFISKNGINSI